MNALVEISFDVVMEQTGRSGDVRRRLSDKILAAFNHAYLVGEFEIARQLRAALVMNEAQAGPQKELRIHYDPLGEAALWTDFVDARNAYRAACDKNDRDGEAHALDIMKEAYRLWSQV